MHGLVFVELERFATATLGKELWQAAARAAGLEERVYVPISSYPDAELVALLTQVSKSSGIAAAALLEQFGAALAPRLLALYKFVVKPEWKALDVIEHTESVIHAVVRRRDPQAQPPQLQCTRNSPEQVTVVYSSARKLCALARGLIAGIGQSYAEGLELTEERCMLQGARDCRIVVRRA